METNDRKRILIIEDEAPVAKGLQYGLKENGYEVIWADSACRGAECLNKHDPHLLILDIRLPDESGFDLCRRMRSQGYKLPILMLTARDADVDKILGLELGADDYVIKPFNFRELLSRIRALLRRSYGDLSFSHYMERAVFGDVVIETNRLRAFKNKREVFLTATEFKILKYLLERPDIPASRDDLISDLWGFDNYYGDERTVDVHIRHLREKLEDDPGNPRWILTIRGYGYKFNPL